MEPGLWVSGLWVIDFGRVGSVRVSLLDGLIQTLWYSDHVFEPVLSFNIRVYRGVVSTE